MVQRGWLVLSSPHMCPLGEKLHIQNMNRALKCHCKAEKLGCIKQVLWSNLGFRICMTLIYPEWAECANVDVKNKVNSAEQKIS